VLDSSVSSNSRKTTGAKPSDRNSIPNIVIEQAFSPTNNRRKNNSSLYKQEDITMLLSSADRPQSKQISN
jgi:hypothetical protein